MEDPRKVLADYVCDYNEAKSRALLDLIDYTVKSSCKLPNVEMVLSDDTCEWCHGRDCWLNIPDSVSSCEGRCDKYLRRKDG